MATIPNLPLYGCLIALHGNFPGQPQPDVVQEFLSPLGCSFSRSIDESTTHVVMNETSFERSFITFKQAREYLIPVVSVSWLEKCLEKMAKVDENEHAPPEASTMISLIAQTTTDPTPRNQTLSAPVCNNEDDILESIFDTDSLDLGFPADESYSLTNY